MKFILGEKIGMSQVFAENGRILPVTLIEAGPCEVTQIKTKEKDGYEAIQIGFKKIEKKKKIKKTMKGKNFRYLQEFKEKIEDFKIGQKIDVSTFQKGDAVKISGLTKGRGFQGVVKRWNFAGRPATRGTKHELRTPGSVGSMFPQRVIKGKKMPGRMGGERVTVKNLEVVEVDKDKNLLAIKGAVPGRKGTLLEISSEKSTSSLR